MRTHVARAAVAAAALAVVALVLWTPRPSGDDASLETRVVPGPPAGVDVASETPLSGLGVLRTTGLPATTAGPPAVEFVSPWIDVFVLRGDGSPLLDDRTAPTRWFEPCLVDAGQEFATPADRLWPHATRAVSEPGWYTAIARPGYEAEVVLAFSREIVARVPVPAGADRVELRFDPGDIDRIAASISGAIDGWRPDVGQLVLTRPGTSFRRVVDSSQEGGFLCESLPPGLVRLELRAEHRSRAAARRADGRGGEPWQAWSEYLREHSERTYVFQGDLRRGEHLDLGTIRPERAAFAVLELSDRNGAPIDASLAQVHHVTDGASRPDICALDGSRLILFPLAAEPARLCIVAGPDAAFVDVVPTDSTEPVPVRLEAASVIALGDSGQAGWSVELASGAAVPIASRWHDSVYAGWRIGHDVRFVPEGDYRTRTAVGLTTFHLPPGHVADLRDGTGATLRPLESTASAAGR